MTSKCLYSVLNVGRSVAIRKSVTTSTLRYAAITSRTFSTTPTTPVTKPEDVIAECAKIRESIQALNDVSTPYTIYLN